jgi:hypothetical protein
MVRQWFFSLNLRIAFAMVWLWFWYIFDAKVHLSTPKTFAMILQWILQWRFNTTWFRRLEFLVPFIAKLLQNHCKSHANFAFSSSDSSQQSHTDRKPVTSKARLTISSIWKLGAHPITSNRASSDVWSAAERSAGMVMELGMWGVRWSIGCLAQGGRVRVQSWVGGF